MLVDCPRKLIIQLPCNNRHNRCEEPNDARNCNQVWSNVRPDRNAWPDPSFEAQSFNCLVDLVVLDGCINQHTNIVDAEPNDLNGVLQSKGVVNQDKLIEETEDKEGEVGRNRFC